MAANPVSIVLPESGRPARGGFGAPLTSGPRRTGRPFQPPSPPSARMTPSASIRRAPRPLSPVGKYTAQGFLSTTSTRRTPGRSRESEAERTQGWLSILRRRVSKSAARRLSVLRSPRRAFTTDGSGGPFPRPSPPSHESKGRRATHGKGRSPRPTGRVRRPAARRQKPDPPEPASGGIFGEGGRFGLRWGPAPDSSGGVATALDLMPDASPHASWSGSPIR